MRIIIALILSLLFCSCFQETKLLGHWSMELQIQNKPIPFQLNFLDNSQVEFINGLEKVSMSYTVQDNKIKVPILNFDAEIELEKKDRILKGFWIRHNRAEEYKVPIMGMKLPKKLEYKVKSLPLASKWKIDFYEKDKVSDEAILLFSKKEDNVYASILTQTGDYRYLTPNFTDDKLILTGFDGTFSFYFEGEVSDNSYKGTMYSGKSWNQPFHASVNNNFELKDPESITTYTGDIFSLKFDTLSGKKMNIKKDNQAVTVVQIFGSWCPNCIDETRFINNWRQSNREKKVNFNLVSFERSPNKSHAIKQLSKAAALYNIDYPVFIGGYTKEDKINKVLPGLENFISFPTTIFIDKKGNIKKIHAGFSGPATGKYYEKFASDFDKFISKLLNE